MEQGKRRKYDRDFKVEAVKLATGSGRTVAEVVRNLGIHENLLYKWKEKYVKDSEYAFPSKGHLKPAEEELRQMKKALADVTQERDILKKALAIFSREPK
jgi:transposase